VGLARAAELAVAELAEESVRLARLRDQLERRLTGLLPEVTVNGAGAARLPHISSLSVPDADGEALLMVLDLEGIAASGGSACLSGALAGSPVLAAMGRARPGHAAVRFSLGRTTTEAEIEAAAARIANAVSRVRGRAENPRSPAG
jgi:cysteine desulfurase